MRYLTSFALILTLSMALGATPARADPNPQLVNSVEIRLSQFGLSADVSQFATSTVTRLHFALSERQPYWKKRQELKWILQNAKYK